MEGLIPSVRAIARQPRPVSRPAVVGPGKAAQTVTQAGLGLAAELSGQLAQAVAQRSIDLA